MLANAEILIAEDSPTQAAELQYLLESAGCEVRVARNGVEALAKIAADLPDHQIEEFATGPALRSYIDRKNVSGNLRADLFILDGEAVPEGGMGIARQLKDEVFNCPPVLLITGRREDAWLAAWSRAEASVIHPIDPFTLANTVANLMRTSAVATA